MAVKEAKILVKGFSLVKVNQYVITVLRDNIQGVTKSSIRRGGVKHISGLMCEETRGVLNLLLHILLLILTYICSGVDGVFFGTFKLRLIDTFRSKSLLRV